MQAIRADLRLLNAYFAISVMGLHYGYISMRNMRVYFLLIYVPEVHLLWSLEHISVHSPEDLLRYTNCPSRSVRRELTQQSLPSDAAP